MSTLRSDEVQLKEWGGQRQTEEGTKIAGGLFAAALCGFIGWKLSSQFSSED
jgi:hypothetical protein